MLLLVTKFSFKLCIKSDMTFILLYFARHAASPEVADDSSVTHLIGLANEMLAQENSHTGGLHVLDLRPEHTGTLHLQK